MSNANPANIPEDTEWVELVGQYDRLGGHYTEEEVAEVNASEVEVYLDYWQCDELRIAYDDIVYWREVRADRLLASKGGDGYDARHFEILGPMRAKTIRIARVNGMAPGWFKVLK